MKKRTIGRIARIVAWTKAPKTTYLVRHPLKGPRNLLALYGAKSLLKTRAAAVTAAAVVTTAVAAPLAVKALRNNHERE